MVGDLAPGDEDEFDVGGVVLGVAAGDGEGFAAGVAEFEAELGGASVAGE